MNDLKVITAKSCLAYDADGHPENSARVARTQELLQRQGYTFVEAASCTEHDILRVHSHRHLETVRSGKFFDTDTPNIPGIFEHAKLAAGAAMQAAEFALHGHPAFSLMRPPGHHATRNQLMGFCYFNNIAIAVAGVLEAGTKPKSHDYDHGMAPKRVATLDFDCHHGNGTEDIFHGHPNVLFVSLHQSPCYPGTGNSNTSNCINYPLPAQTSEKEYLVAFEDALLRIAAFHPNLLAVSAGFDAFHEDPITQMNLEVSTFGKIGKAIRDLKLPTFSVLEGGYSGKLPECVATYLEGLAG
ncbi:MAG: histone deacetylase [Verrucomicrobiae bacterium]|nr:histone deacetylase [Verrucomicrobiae bacterium]